MNAISSDSPRGGCAINEIMIVLPEVRRWSWQFCDNYRWRGSKPWRTRTCTGWWIRNCKLTSITVLLSSCQRNVMYHIHQDFGSNKPVLCIAVITENVVLRSSYLVASTLLLGQACNHFYNSTRSENSDSWCMMHGVSVVHQIFRLEMDFSLHSHANTSQCDTCAGLFLVPWIGIIPQAIRLHCSIIFIVWWS